MISNDEKDAFWEIVAECLSRYYGVERANASGMASHLRERIEPSGVSNEMVYHAEPLDIASDLAGATDKGASIRREAQEDYLQLLARVGRPKPLPHRLLHTTD